MSLVNIEKELNIILPSDYKSYVLSLEDSFLDPSMSFSLIELTPFGDGVIEELYFLDDLNKTDFYLRKIGMLIIGDNTFGNTVCLSLDSNSIYYYDSEERYYWDDEKFYTMFSDLKDSIIQYLEKRRGMLLPYKEPGMENFYLIANSFSEFIKKCKPIE